MRGKGNIRVSYLTGFTIDENDCPPGKRKVSGTDYGGQPISGVFDEQYIQNDHLLVGVCSRGAVSDGAIVRTRGGHFSGRIPGPTEGKTVPYEFIRGVSIKRHNLETI